MAAPVRSPILAAAFARGLRMSVVLMLMLVGVEGRASEFLPVDHAYALSAESAGADAVRVRFAIADGWCVTCKVNEKVAIETDEMKGRFTSKGVALVKADWTNQDATICAELA